jgi:phage protein D
MISLAIGAVQTITSYVGDQAEYEKQEAYRLDNIKRANASALDQYNQTALRQTQEGDAAGLQKEQVIRDARAARATASAAAGEAGISGLSVDMLLADFYGKEGSYKDQLDQQTEWTNAQFQYEQKGIRATAEDRANSIAPATPPSFMSAGLRILGNGVDSFGSYNRNIAAKRA